MFRKFSEMNEIRITEKSVYLHIHQKGPISKSTLVKELGGSLTNINRFVAGLEEEGLILGSKGSGRKAGEYRVNPDAVYAIGGYINSDVIGLGLCDIAGRVHASVEDFYDRYADPEDALCFFEKASAEVASQVDGDKLLGSGVGIVGPLDNDRRTILSPEQLPGWHNMPIAELLEKRTSLAVTLDYFTETALMGELFFKKHDLKKDIGLLWIDKGVGSSIYNRGKLNLNHRDQSFVLAHQVIDFKGSPCVCGRRGCLHTYGSIPSVERHLSPFISFDEGILRENEALFREKPWEVSPELETIFQTFESGLNSRQIALVLEELKEAYFAALGNYIYLLRPEKVIFCGRMAHKFQGMFTEIMEMIDKHTGYFPDMSSSVSWLDLRSENMIQGGASLVFNKYLNFSV